MPFENLLGRRFTPKPWFPFIKIGKCQRLEFERKLNSRHFKSLLAGEPRKAGDDWEPNWKHPAEHPKTSKAKITWFESK